MSSNPSQPAPEWPASAGPAAPEPLGALPSSADGFAAAGPGPHTGPQEPWSSGPEEAWPGGPRRWPTARASWPGQGGAADRPEPPEPDDERLGMLSYLGVPFLGPVLPLAVYLFKRHTSAFVRYHSAQAVSLSVTALLYTICVLILGAMLALDSLNLALVIAVPVAALLWLAILGYVILAAFRAFRGHYYRIPSWLCATIVR
jgi:uncharacterized Tic20 family protein